MGKVIDISKLSHEDREQAESWFCSHSCDAAYPDMIIIEDRSSGIGVATIAACSCDAELDLTDYGNW